MTEIKSPGTEWHPAGANIIDLPRKGNIDMRKIGHRKPVRYGFCDLPLFAWASAREFSSLTIRGRWLRRRYKVPRELANLVAELAGIGQEHER
jgi:hypothetical protein